MCGGRDTHGGTVVLSVGLGAVPAQEQAAQIRHRITENREQFRVRVGSAEKCSGPGANQVAHCCIDRPELVRRVFHPPNARGVNIYSI